MKQPSRCIQILTLALLVNAMVAVQSCTSQTHVREQRTVDEFKVLREYTLPTEDTDPQPQWALSDNRIIVRSQRGLGVLNEGRNNRQFYNLKDARRIGHPTWMDDTTILLSSPDFMVTPQVDASSSTAAILRSDTAVATESHIALALIEADGMQLREQRTIEGVSAFGTQRIDKQQVYAQKGESIVRINMRGDVKLYDQGFFPRPQANGKGVALQTTPVIEKDYWTGKKGNGELLVRWKKGHVSMFPSLIQAQWCHDGGILATRLNAVPQHPHDWQFVDSDIVYIPAGSDEMQVVLTHAHSPTPHPQTGIAAVFVAQQGVFLLDYLQKKTQFVSEDGTRPQWNHDGKRLLTEVLAKDKTQHLRIFVFQELMHGK